MKLLIPDTYVDYDTYRFPFKGQGLPRVSSGFGSRFHPILRFTRFHEGLDFPKSYGTSVYPSRSGRVQFAGWQEGYGRLVIIRHGDGATTRYGHLSAIGVKKGQWVSRAKTLIGKVGQSGLSTGPHLHFEVRDRFGKPLNPSRKIGRK
ncbi:MAG: M23 family metallopeptidase [candidate division Zixibacteria bacterium]|nr:M23 family metallopeptidase [candidate division Zixibacteria bacterium]